MTKRSVNYWFVGAAKSGNDDHYNDFIQNGYWKLFWAKGEQPAQEAKRIQMQPGDWIAIKKMVGGSHSQGKVRIRALGTIEEVSRTERSVQVKWLLTGLNHIIDGHGLYGSIHGPFKHENGIVQETFLEVIDAAESQKNGNAIAKDIVSLLRHREIDETTRQALIDARIGQGKFRSDVLVLWDNCCAVTKSKTLEAIRASHIKPWRGSTNTERLDPSNGIPLVASLDALFDVGLISFDESGQLLVSSALTDEEKTIFGVCNAKLSRRLSERTAGYLTHHRKSIFRA